jgi:hypothetical protein
VFGGTPIYIPKVDALIAVQGISRSGRSITGTTWTGWRINNNLAARTVRRIIDGEPEQQIDGQMGIDDYHNICDARHMAIRRSDAVQSR